VQRCAADPRPESFARARRHCYSHLVCFGRHTVTGLLRAQNRLQEDWSADYRFYSRDRFDEEKVFANIRQEIEKMTPSAAPLVVAMDDSLLRKTGCHIAGVRYQRDPLSPPFHVNFVRGLRVLQISAAVAQANGGARLIPIDFQHAALPAKPRKGADAERMAAYEAERQKRNINRVGLERLSVLRRQMDEQGSKERRLVASIDGRFTNGTVLRGKLERTVLIGRVRKDAVFHYAPNAQEPRGRRRKYGERAPTPQQLLEDESIPFQSVRAFACGEMREFQVKTLAPLYMPMNKAEKPVRLIVIKPVAYRSRVTRKLQRREPAYLICTDLEMPLSEILQDYIWRWDIEINFRDEKTVLGVGQAQVRGEAANQHAPSLAVAAYALLLLAATKTYGAGGRPATLPQPRWHKRKPEARGSANDLINQLRLEMWGAAIKQKHFQAFTSREPSDQNPAKCEPSLAASVFLSLK
jgi:hypothetical protein